MPIPPDFGSANARVRCWLHMAALVVLAAALPITFIVVRDSAAELGTPTSSLMVRSDESDGSNATVRFHDSARTVTPLATSELPAGQLARTSVEKAEQGEVVVPLQEALLNQLRSVSPAISVVYLVGVLMMLVRLAAAICGGQRLTSLGHPVTEPSILDVLATEAERLALKALPKVAYCERVAVPVVVGVLKPVILLPAAMMSGLSSQELAAVLAHELAHVKRFDHVLIVVQRFLEAVLFFHPAVWWLGRRIHDEREHACDDLVIKGGTDRLDYARSLLRVAELRVHSDAQANQLAQLAIDGGHPSKLRQRIQRIVQSNDEPGVRLNQSRATFALVATALAITVSLVPVIPNVSQNPADAAPAQAAADKEQRPAADANSKTTANSKPDSGQQSTLEKKLDGPAELHIEELPLIAAISQLEELSGVSFTVDLGEFALRGVDSQTPMTLDVEGVTLRSLVDQLTKQAHLTFEVQQNGIRIPATTPPLEFRLVPATETVETDPRDPEELDGTGFRDGTVARTDPAKVRTYAWFPILRQKPPVIELPDSLINGDFRLGLLSDSADHILTADGTWHVLEVEIQDDDFGQRNIRVKLDQLGGLHMQRLSKLCLDQKMAMIVNGVIVTAPIVRSEIGREFVITGNFSNDELTRIADGIRGAMVPAGKELTYKCDVTDEKTGEPIAGAEVLWRVRKSPYKNSEAPIFQRRFTTDRQGRYTVAFPCEAFEFAQSTIEFEVQHPDYLPKKNVGTRLTLPDAPKPSWSDLRHLKIMRGVPVTGRFVNPDGSPAANLALMVSRSRDAPGAGFRGDVIGRTDKDGRYRIATTGSWPKRLHWFPENFVSDSVALNKVTDSPEPITFGDQGTIRLKNGPRLTGRVVDQDGKPLAGVFVETFTGTTVPVLYAESDANGNFTFTPSPPGEYRVSTTDGFIDPLTETFRGRTLRRPFTRETVKLPKFGKAQPVIIKQAPSNAVTITAYDEDGGPALNKQFWTGAEPYRDATSEPIDGEPGKYRLWVRRGRSGTVTTHLPPESATVWQRNPGTDSAPGTDLFLGKVKQTGDEVVLRFRQSGVIRLVVKAGDKVVPWDARSLSVKYARAAEFAKLGVRHPGFVITVPKQGPEHMIQRVAPGEDVIIDVGVKGELRKKQTVRVGAGETKTITIDPAQGFVEASAANSNAPEEPLNKVVAPQADEVRFAAVTVKYDIANGGSDAEARIILENTGLPNGEIGNKQKGMMRYTPVKNGESMQLNKLVPGEYQVARFREVEIITLVGRENDPKGPRVNSGVYMDRQRFTLKAGDQKQLVFQRPKGQRVKGLVTNMTEFNPNRTIVEICSPNAKDTDIGRGLDTTVFDAHQCNDGKFETDALAPGKYVAIVSGYDAWTEGQMNSTSLPRPHFVGSVEFTIPQTGKAEPIEIKLRDALKKAD
jgi:beta-lactamase regulating signal transducer with metallopeptidase domain/protocatechuate 3,4-dioxygenase beta subunit